jgi:plasmid maintenance system antidote protein VapI
MDLKQYCEPRGQMAGLAVKMGVSRQYIFQLIRGERPITDKTKKKIKKASGGKVTELPDRY